LVVALRQQLNTSLLLVAVVVLVELAMVELVAVVLVVIEQHLGLLWLRALQLQLL
jgi:hypothetical protein